MPINYQPINGYNPYEGCGSGFVEHAYLSGYDRGIKHAMENESLRKPYEDQLGLIARGAAESELSGYHNGFDAHVKSMDTPYPMTYEGTPKRINS